MEGGKVGLGVPDAPASRMPLAPPAFHLDPSWLPAPKAALLLDELLARLPLRQEEIVLFGQRRLQPRLSLSH